MGRGVRVGLGVKVGLGVNVNVGVNVGVDVGVSVAKTEAILEGIAQLSRNKVATANMTTRFMVFFPFLSVYAVKQKPLLKA